MEEKIVANDLLKIYEKVEEKGKTKKRVITVLAWGDPLQVGEKSGKEIAVRVNARFWRKGEYVSGWRDAFVSAKAKFISKARNDVIKLSICDVQQGDACILETPKGRKLFVDCGENQLFARYLAARYGGSSAKNRVPVDAIVFTHGDKDHFGGLLEIQKAEKNTVPRKRIFIDPNVIYHNGLIKKSSKNAKEVFGSTADKGGRTYVVNLVDDLVGIDPKKLNKEFRSLRNALDRWNSDPSIEKRGGIRIRRISNVTDGSAFDFLRNEGIGVRILAPIETSVGGNAALPLFRKPAKAVPESQGQALDANLKLSASYSASHTINGNSIVLLISYGNIRLLLTGDINQESESAILERCSEKRCSLRADILKAPHHGSHEFSTKFLARVRPVVSVISSGDEKEMVEYIHPRATLVGALGKYSRVPQPLVFMTELVAFFKYRGRAVPVGAKGVPKKERSFTAFERSSYGIVHMCFNRERVLVFTHTGKRDLKEAYSFGVDRRGKAQFKKVSIV